GMSLQECGELPAPHRENLNGFQARHGRRVWLTINRGQLTKQGSWPTYLQDHLGAILGGGEDLDPARDHDDHCVRAGAPDPQRRASSEPACTTVPGELGPLLLGQLVTELPHSDLVRFHRAPPRAPYRARRAFIQSSLAVLGAPRR